MATEIGCAFQNSKFFSALYFDIQYCGLVAYEREPTNIWLNIFLYIKKTTKIRKEEVNHTHSYLYTQTKIEWKKTTFYFYELLYPN